MALFDLFASTDQSQVLAKLTSLEAKIDLIMAHLGIEPSDPDPIAAEILQIARSGNKIAAIKMYRDRTGAGLAEAKSAVEDGLLGKGPLAGQ
ncbi:MAG: hypothetical protein JSR77_10455 [Planctomycetes bacterium]|nr:hypothetical protein [Planctomycetota bacterium]